MATDPGSIEQQFARDGFVEFRLSPVKVTFAIVMLIGLPVVFALIAASKSAVFLGLAVLIDVWIYVAVGAVLSEQVLGKGPALRVGPEGLTVRRWRYPLLLRWTDVAGIISFRESRWVGTQIGIQLSPWVWHDYRTARPAWIKPIDRITHYRSRVLCPIKIFTVPHASILAFLSPESLDRLTVPTPPYRLVLDVGYDGESPIWLRGGRPFPLTALKLAEGTRTAIHGWNKQLNRLSEMDPSGPEWGPEADTLVTEGRELASQIEADLGEGSEVLASQDVPIWR